MRSARRTAGRGVAAGALWLPLWIAVFYVVALSSTGIVRRLLVPHPLDPWEAGLTVEGWRAMRGLPIYEDATRAEGHATLMYGALAPYALAGVFSVMGPGNRAPRLFTLACAIVIIVVLTVTAARAVRLTPWMAGVAAALFLGLELHSGHYFAVNRPDMPALALGVLGVILLFRGHQSQRLVEYIAGTALVIVAMFFKQSAAILAAVPALPALLDRRHTALRRLAWAALPTLGVIAALMALSMLAPPVYQQMITVPREYNVSLSRAVLGGVSLLSSLPIFLACFLYWVAKGRASGDWGPVWLWVLSAIGVTLPTCALMVAKSGGTVNSWLPALFALVFFVALCLRRLDDMLRDERRPLAKRLAVSGSVAALILVSYAALYKNLGHLDERPEYPRVIRAASALAGSRVSSPEDPTIALLGVGQAVRSIYLELDSSPRDGEWVQEVPDIIARDIAGARYAVDVEGWWADRVRPEHFVTLGFERMSVIGRYAIWRKRMGER